MFQAVVIFFIAAQNLSAERHRKVFYSSPHVIQKKGRNTSSVLWTKYNYKNSSPADILLKRHLCKTEHGKTQEVLKVNHEQISLLVSVTEEGCEF